MKPETRHGAGMTVEPFMQFLVDAELPTLDPTRNELHPAAELLGQVIALAADDCRRALATPAFSSLTDRQMIESSSAAQFLLSLHGQAMICAAGLGVAGVKLAATLANAALARMDLTIDQVQASPQDWCKAIELASRSGAVQKKVTPISGVVRFRQEHFPFALAG